MHRVVVLVLAALLCAPAFADDGPRGRFGEGRGERGARLSPQEREAKKAEIAQKLRTYVTVELATRLALDEKRALKLSEAVGAHMTRKQAARKALRAEHDKLAQMIATADDKALAAQIAVVSKRTADLDVHDELLADCAKFLSVKEQAKLVVAIPDVMREVGKLGKAGRGRFRDRGDDAP